MPDADYDQTMSGENQSYYRVSTDESAQLGFIQVPQLRVMTSNSGFVYLLQLQEVEGEGYGWGDRKKEKDVLIT